MRYYYTTQAFLSWCLNHCFYNGKHYTYLASCFYTYRLPNPKSSNPLLIYQDLYQPWKDQDPFDKYIAQTRINIRKGIAAQFGKGVISPVVARRLTRVCDKVEITFFYPVVYRVDIDAIGPPRKKTAGSGTAGSHEFLIEDLDRSEFDIFFQDLSMDSDFDTLKTLKVGDWRAALPILASRCIP